MLGSAADLRLDEEGPGRETAWRRSLASSSQVLAARASTPMPSASFTQLMSGSTMDNMRSARSPQLAAPTLTNSPFKIW